MMQTIIRVLILLLLCSDAFSADIYVDQTSADCTGNYSIANRSCTGSDGDSWSTLAEAFTNMSAGDHLVLRGGTYTGCWTIPTSKNGSAWTDGNYNKISSYTGEWAVLDGDQSCTTYENTVIGNANDTVDGTGDLKYWWFERLEVTGGGASGETNGPGVWINGGPFKIKYCYIHDNGKSNPGVCDYASTATMGYGWRNSEIKYNWFEDNGSTASNNCKQIAWDENYGITDEIERHGVSINSTTGIATSNGVSAITNLGNEISYNYVTGGAVGIAPKHFVWRTGRDTTDSDYSDTYSANGTKIHHNIILNTGSYAIGAHGDFDQIYNNIMDGTGFGIRSMYDTWTSGGYTFHYKVAAYNNTGINIDHGGVYSGYGARTESWMNDEVWAYLYNNISDGNSDYNNYATEGGITPKMKNSSELTLDYSNTEISKNYTYRPGDSVHYRMDRTSYTTSEFESQTVSSSPRVGYLNSYDSGNLLYKGTTGANKYIPTTTHTIESGVTMTNGGVDIDHPYLSGVTIPSYVGAVNPGDYAWVDGVLSDLASTTWLQGTADRDANDDPDWIEGATEPATTANINCNIN